MTNLQHYYYQVKNIELKYENFRQNLLADLNDNNVSYSDRDIYYARLNQLKHDALNSLKASYRTKYANTRY